LPEPCILLLVPDLFFLAKISSTAREVGVATATLLPGQDPAEAARKTGARALIVDLDLEGADPIDLAAKLRVDGAAPVRLVGIFSHVHAERRGSALREGFDLVLPRSKFSAELPFLLRELAAGGAGPQA
jgi:DNA-binding NarL/FixJ family response regulator